MPATEDGGSSTKQKNWSRKKKTGGLRGVDGGDLSDNGGSSSGAGSSSEEEGGQQLPVVEMPELDADELDVENKRLSLVKAAKEDRWNVVEYLLKRLPRRDKRLNAAHPETGETTLMLACAQSRFLIVERLCLLKVPVNFRANDRRTAIHYAAQFGHEEILKTLLSYNADPNIYGGELNQLPLHIAACRAHGGLNVAQILLRSSLKEAVLARDATGNLPLFYAVQTGYLSLVKEMLQIHPKEQVAWRNDTNGDYLVHIVTRLGNTAVMGALGFDANADVNVQNSDGLTPLHIAARQGDLAMLKLLHTLKANPDVPDKNEYTPLHVASDTGQTAVVDFLVERFKANVFLRTKDGSTLMHLAAERGYADTILSFVNIGVPLNMPNKVGTLCLHVAAKNGHVHVAKTLIARGSKVNARNKSGETALHIAVINHQPDIIQVLLGAGAHLDFRGGPSKEAPLHLAARLPDVICAQMLLECGAIVNNTTEETLETPLHVAARSGGVNLTKMLLEDGANPMQLNRAGETALHVAARHCHFEVCKAIIDFANNHVKGKDASNLVNLTNGEGETSFHLAAELGKSQAHEPFEETDIIRLLLENGADPLATTSLTHETSLHYCARSGNPDIMHEIVRHLGGTFQFACNRQDRMGWSPLMTTCQEGHVHVAEIVLINGARADVFDEHGRAALHLAAENGHTACCEILLAYKTFVNAKSKIGMSPLHFAAESGFTKLVKLLIEKYNAAINAITLDKKTPLHLAAGAGRKDVCYLLMTLHADSSAIDELGQNPLHLAVENNHQEVVKLFIKYKPGLVSATSMSGMTCAHIAAKNGSSAVIKELLSYNRSLVTSVPNKENESLPLHLAVSASHEDVVRLLIDAGSSATAENAEGWTAAHLAAREGDLEVIQSIPSKSAVKANSSKNGMSAIHVASFYGKPEIIRELQQYCDINAKTEAPQMASAVSDQLLRSLISIDHGLTPLHMASFMGRENVVRLILNDSRVQTDDVSVLLGRVPMFYACMNGHLVIVSLLLSRSTKHLRATDKHGRQPLHLAAEHGHVDMLAMLVGQGVDLSCADEEGWTPLHLATKNGYLDAVKLIIESGASPMVKTVDGNTPMMISAAHSHLDVLNYLMKKPHDSVDLVSNNAFLMNLMLCGLGNGNETVEEFVLHSNAPLTIVAYLTKAFRELASKDKERAKDLQDAARFCETMTRELLGISSELVQPSAVLSATDWKGNQFLDVLLENDMKEVIEHPAVQRYLSDIWSGRLVSWSMTRLLMLFMGFMFCPPLLAYFCLPIKRHDYYHIPVIKFMAMIVSNFYLIGLLSVIAAVPIDPIIYRTDFIPNWYEILCLAWIGGMLVTELTRSGSSTGLGLLRYAIIACVVPAAFFQIAANAMDGGMGTPARDDALIMMYNRNFMLSFSLFSAIILMLDYLLIHQRFGAFGIIISSVLKDLMTYMVVLLLFLVAFCFQISCLYAPITLDVADNTTDNAIDITDNDSNLTNDTDPVIYPTLLPLDYGPLTEVDGNDGVYFGNNTYIYSPDSPEPTINTTNGTVRCRSKLANGTIQIVRQSQAQSRKRRTAADMYSVPLNKSETNNGTKFLIRRKRKARGGGGSSGSSGSGTFANVDDNGDGAPDEQGDDAAGPVITNEDPSSFIEIFQSLYFSMFAMADMDQMPTVLNGPSWSGITFQVYFGLWMIMSAVVLMPLLIAMLTETYIRINQRSDLEWKFGRAKLIRSMIKMSAAPSPLNLIVRPYLYIVSVRKHGKLMFTSRAHIFADEDEHDGAAEALFVAPEDDEHKKDNNNAKLLLPLSSRLKNCLECRTAIVVPVEQEEKPPETTSRKSSLHRGSQSRPMEDVVDWKTAVHNYRVKKAGGIDNQEETNNNNGEH